MYIKVEGQYGCDWGRLGRSGADSMSLGCDCRLGEKLMLERYTLKVEITEIMVCFV